MMNIYEITPPLHLSIFLINQLQITFLKLKLICTFIFRLYFLYLTQTHRLIIHICLIYV